MLFKLFFLVALLVAFQGAQARVFTPEGDLTPNQQTTRLIKRTANIIKRSGQDISRLVKKVRKESELRKAVKSYYRFKLMIRLPAALDGIADAKDKIRANNITFSEYDQSDCDVLELLANEGQRFAKNLVYNPDALASIDQLSNAQSVSDALESLNNLILTKLDPKAECKASLQEAFSVISSRNKEAKAPKKSDDQNNLAGSKRSSIPGAELADIFPPQENDF